MPKLGNSPYVLVQFDAAGNLIDPHALTNLTTAIATAGAKDLVVLVHGWTTDLPEAEQLYERLWGNTEQPLRDRGLDPAKVVVAGLVWPSKPYNANYDGGAALVGTNAVGGGALSVEAPGAPGQVSPAALEQIFAETRKLLGDAAAAPLITAARKTVATNDHAHDLFQAVRTAMNINPSTPDPELRLDARVLTVKNADEAQNHLAAYSMPLQLQLDPRVGEVQGLGEVIGGALSGVENGVAWLLNKASYYAMKKRAGEIGEAFATKVLANLPADLRLHLVGHSFGGRLVASAAHRLGSAGPGVEHLLILQGAFSHNAMTTGKGPFSDVPNGVRGVIAMTCTHNDLATTIAYPLASRLVGDIATALGDEDDPYGAMGANGAQLSDDQLAPDCAGADFQPVRKKVNRFRADTYVIKTAETDAHNNVYNPACGKLLATVITTAA